MRWQSQDARGRAGHEPGARLVTDLRLFAMLVAMTAMAVAMLLSSAPASAQQATVRPVVPSYSGELTVAINKSQILAVDVPFRRVTVGNPDIADILPLTDRTIYVLGRSIGMTNLSIYGRNDVLLAVVDLQVAHDVQGLRAKLAELFPGELIEVREAAGSVLLSGAVSSAQTVSRVMAVAEQYAPGAASNLLSIGGSQQVMLQVRFAEVSRSFARELENMSSISGSDFAVSMLGGLASSPFITSAVEIVSGDVTLDVMLSALESQGVIRTLAEPNLVALSGDTANFLAGGEFPVPVAQELGSVTVEFKEFGVGLSFTPTVVDRDLINLVLVAEVSNIDETFAAAGGTFAVPGVSTRRAQTTVELRDGQSFAIAGLLLSDFSDNIRQVPWLGQIPILGALFRSSSFQRSETELVIIVTPYLVQPAAPGALALPTDTFVPPTDVELFLFGQTEGGVLFPAPASSSDALVAGGGISGAYGHVVE